MNARKIAIGLDVGDKRIGVAVSDPLGICAHPHSVVERKKGCYEEIATLCAVRRAAVVVIGLPLEQDGSLGVQVEKTMRFKEKLAATLANKGLDAIEIVLQDERYTTQAAERDMRGSRSAKKNRKTASDISAASLILSIYLEGSSAFSKIASFSADS